MLVLWFRYMLALGLRRVALVRRYMLIPTYYCLWRLQKANDVFGAKPAANNTRAGDIGGTTMTRDTTGTASRISASGSGAAPHSEVMVDSGVRRQRPGIMSLCVSSLSLLGSDASLGVR